MPSGDTNVICRPGDYLARQEVIRAGGGGRITLEVWNREHFQKMFITRNAPADIEGELVS